MRMDSKSLRNFIVKSFPHFREEQFDDCRFPLLEQIFLSADKQHDLSENLSSQDLVKKALYTINNMLSKGAIIPHELENLKTNILIDSETIIEAYAQSLGSTMSEAVGGSEELSNLPSEESFQYNILSIGCGSGQIEAKLNNYIKEHLFPQEKWDKTPSISWIGTDIYSQDSEDHHLKLSPLFREQDNYYFYLDASRKNQLYWDSVGLDNQGVKIIIANYSLHHIPLKLSEFLALCQGSSSVVLLEELAPQSDWSNPLYRWLRIIYDLVGNMALNPGWAKLFKDNPDQFYVEYLSDEIVKEFGGSIKDIAMISPRTSIITFNLFPCLINE